MQTIFEALHDEWKDVPVMVMELELAPLECAVCEEPIGLGEYFHYRGEGFARACAHTDCIPPFPMSIEVH